MVCVEKKCRFIGNTLFCDSMIMNDWIKPNSTITESS